MPVEVVMPQMGESVVKGTILRWMVKEGDRVMKDQSIVEISTDKIDTEIPSPANGKLSRIVYKEDETVQVGTVIAMIDVAEVGIPTSSEGPEKVRIGGLISEAGVAAKAMPMTLPMGVRELQPRHSPLVRRMAQEYGVVLGEITGTGAGGRITKKDILDYVAAKGLATFPTAAEEKEEIERESLLPLSPRRKIIAERMVESKRLAPHVTTTFEVDMSKIARMRERYKEDVSRTMDIKLTYLPFIIMAATRVLRRFPVFNASWSDKGIIVKNYINIGIAVSLPDGLIVPVIMDADKKTIVQLAKESQELADRARSKRLSPDEVQNGTFTITNYGAGGSLFGTPIILQPQVAIMGIGAITKRPVVIDDAIAIRAMMYLSLSFDHRVMDGAMADEFLSMVKNLLERAEFKIDEKMPPPKTGFGGVW